MNSNSPDDDDVRSFREEYPDVYAFVLKVINGQCDDDTLQAFKDEYGEASLEDLLKFISGKASEKDIQEFRDEFGDDIYNAIVKMTQNKNPVIEGVPEAGLDEAVWEKAKPHLIKIYQENERAGNSASTFVQLVIKSFGAKIKPYLLHFMKEVRDGKIDVRAENKIETTKFLPKREKFKKGDFIGQKYEVFDVLGEGGFGIVYLVYSKWDKSVYALKTIKEEYLENINIRKRFIKETQAWIDLERHPSLVRAYFVDEISGRLYIAMDYIAPDEQGLNSLDAYLKHRPPDLAQTLRWAIQFCHGMEYAYSKGIKAHRDIKPANIMIDQNKTVKISDFGLAGVITTTKSSSDVKLSAPRNSNGETYQTMEGTALGTPPYMPPEQFENAAACDERSDIYSFGIVLYQMVSGGNLPFYPDMTGSKADNVLQDWYRLHCKAAVPELKSPLFSVVQRCLEKEPKRRYPSFKDLRAELDVILKQETGEIVRLPERKELEAWEWSNKGLSFNSLGHYDEAIQCYDKALEIDPHDSDTLSNIGLCFDNLGYFDKAVSFYGRALHINPHDAIIWSNLSLSLYHLEKYNEAIDCCDNALTIDAKLAVAWTNKGNCFYCLHHLEDALDCYNNALQSNIEETNALIGKGNIYAALNNFDAALKAFDAVIKLNSGDWRAWYNKCFCEYKLGMGKSSSASFKRFFELAPAEYKYNLILSGKLNIPKVD